MVGSSVRESSLGRCSLRMRPQLHPLDDSLEQRQGTDVIGAEFEAVGLGVFARDDFRVWGGVVRGPSDWGRASVSGIADHPEEGRRKSADVRPGGPRGGRGRQDGKVFAEIILLEL